MQKVVFRFGNGTGIIQIFFKKAPRKKFVKNATIFCKIFGSMRNFIVLQYLFDDLDEVVWYSEMKGKSFCYVCFFLKNCYE